MQGVVSKWIGAIGALILVFLVVKNGEQFKSIANATTAAHVGLIRRLQGRQSNYAG